MSSLPAPSLGRLEPEAEVRLRAVTASAAHHRDQAAQVYAIRQIQGKRRGVVATRAIPVHTEIVTCPVVTYDWTDAGRIEKTRLGDYNFRFGAEGQRACIVLGVISLCNHSDSPNAEVVCHEADEAMTLLAIRPIAAGEEICIRYRRTLWFTPAA
jgi:uncharacterized protein